MHDAEHSDPKRMVTLLDLGPRQVVQSFPTFTAFVERMTGRLTKSWIFVETAEKPAPGSTVRVELMLDDGAMLIRALGVAAEVYDHESDEKPAGVRVDLSYVDPASAGMIESLYRHARDWPQESEIKFDRRPAVVTTAAAAKPDDDDAPAMAAAAAMASAPQEPAAKDDDVTAGAEVSEGPSSGIYEQEIARALEALEIDEEPAVAATAAVPVVEPVEPDVRAAAPAPETEPVELDVDALEIDALEIEVTAEADGGGLAAETPAEDAEAVTEPEKREMEQALEELEIARALDRLEPDEERRRPTTEGVVVPLPEADGVEVSPARDSASADWLDVPLLVDDEEPERPEAPFLAAPEPATPARVPPAPMPAPPPAASSTTPTPPPLDPEQSAAIPTWATSETDEYDRERLRALSRVRESAPGPGPSRLLVGGGLLALVIAVGLLAIWRSGAADRWRDLLLAPAESSEIVAANGDTPASGSGGGASADGVGPEDDAVRQDGEPVAATGNVAPPPAASPPPVVPPPPVTAPPPVAPPPVAPPTTAPPPAGGTAAAAAREGIGQTVERWRQAWSGQRVDDYLATYAPSFRPTDGRSREAWAASRRERLLAPQSIEVETNSLSIELLSADRGRAWFRQIYIADGVRRQTWKSLEMERRPDGWKIRQERIEPGPPS